MNSFSHPLTQHPRDMQNCFRQYPEIYGSEIDNDDDDDDADDMTAAAADASTPSASTPQPTTATESAPKQTKTKSVAPAPSGPHSAEKVAENRRELGLVPENYRPEEKEVKKQEPVSESEGLVPKAAHDGR